VISVAFKTPVEKRLGICICKIHFCIDPMTVLVSHQTVPPHFTKLRQCVQRCFGNASYFSSYLLFILRIVVNIKTKV